MGADHGRVGSSGDDSELGVTFRLSSGKSQEDNGWEQDNGVVSYDNASTAIRTSRLPEARLLIVDDEPMIVELLSESLRFAGFEVVTARNGTEALSRAREYEPDLLVLDVMMPGLDGFEVVRRLRADSMTMPVVFLTARDGQEDAVKGLSVGADDYIRKPFGLAEVIARIRTVLRRSGMQPPAFRQQHMLRYADLELDEHAHEVTRAGQLMELSPTEFKVLQYLMENPGRVLSKSQILDHVWQYDFGGEANIVESYISHLRRKVDATSPALIHTVRGVGYVLRVPRS